MQPDELRYNPRADEIVSAARSGRVPVHLVSSESLMPHLLSSRVHTFFSDFSEKNPLQTVSNDATVVTLLELFSRGAHRGP
jgi:hypothetical protein